MLKDAESVPGFDETETVIELGSGGGYLKELCPSVITSDVVSGVAERVIDGRHLPFADSSVRAILLTHVFHHIPDVEAFLAEAVRVLVGGGVVSMVEASHTPFARFFFDCCHPEPYDDRAKDWAFDKADVKLDANQALPWIVFYRDRMRFQNRFPQLVLERAELLPWLGYLLSGGVSRRNLFPSFLVPVFRVLDRWSHRLNSLMALHWHVTLRKREQHPLEHA